MATVTCVQFAWVQINAKRQKKRTQKNNTKPNGTRWLFLPSRHYPSVILFLFALSYYIRSCLFQACFYSYNVFCIKSIYSLVVYVVSSSSLFPFGNAFAFLLFPVYVSISFCLCPLCDALLFLYDASLLVLFPSKGPPLLFVVSVTHTCFFFNM